MAEDYYQVLGVDKKSTAEEIKKAYRKLPSNGIRTKTRTIRQLKKNSKKSAKPMLF